MIYKIRPTKVCPLLTDGLFALFTFAILPSCGSHAKSTSPDKSENFQLFYQRFHSNPGFQLSPINSPLEVGLIEAQGEQKWTRINWPLMQGPIWKINEPGCQTDYWQTDTESYQNVWIENSDFILELAYQLDALGLSKISAMIIGYLIISEKEEAQFDELASKASVSNYIRILEKIIFVIRYRKDGQKNTEI